MNSHGCGKIDFKIPEDIIIEDGVRLFNYSSFSFGKNIYIGHNTILYGYKESTFNIGSNVWIGPQCYLHSAGNITIENQVGIGPGVNIFTSYHDIHIKSSEAIRLRKLIFKPVILKYGCDIGVKSIINPGVTIGQCSQIGSGSIVTKDIPDYSVACGNPCRVLYHI